MTTKQMLEKSASVFKELLIAVFLLSFITLQTLAGWYFYSVNVGTIKQLQTAVVQNQQGQQVVATMIKELQELKDAKIDGVLGKYLRR